MLLTPLPREQALQLSQSKGAEAGEAFGRFLRAGLHLSFPCKLGVEAPRFSDSRRVRNLTGEQTGVEKPEGAGAAAAGGGG